MKILRIKASSLSTVYLPQAGAQQAAHLGYQSQTVGPVLQEADVSRAAQDRYLRLFRHLYSSNDRVTTISMNQWNKSASEFKTLPLGKYMKEYWIKAAMHTTAPRILTFHHQKTHKHWEHIANAGSSAWYVSHISICLMDKLRHKIVDVNVSNTALG